MKITIELHKIVEIEDTQERLKLEHFADQIPEGCEPIIVWYDDNIIWEA